MFERGSPAFYREQAARLKALAAKLDDPLAQVQFRDIAKSFQMLADFAALSQAPAPKTPVLKAGAA
jgi:hypothetical protein